MSADQSTEYSSQHDRLVFLDCDGVLAVEKGSWTTIHEKMGTIDHQQKHLERYEDGEMGMVEWSEKTVRNWEERPVSYLNEAVVEAEKTDGLRATIEQLKEREFAIGVVSAGVLQYVEHIVGDMPVDFIISNDIKTADGKLTGDAEIKVTDRNKIDWFREAVAECSVPESNVVLVGDAVNDLQKVHPDNLAIAFNPQSKAAENVADHVITEETDLERIIAPIDHWLENTVASPSKYS